MSRAQLTSTVEQNTGGAVSPYVAGKNVVINGGFDIWARGTSFTGSGAYVYTTDRWQGFLASTYSITQIDVSSLVSNFQWGARGQRASGQTTTNYFNLEQGLETKTILPLRGNVVTVSFWARCGANFSPTSSQLGVAFFCGTGTERVRNVTAFTSETTPINTNATLTTTYQKFTFTSTAIPTTATQAALTFSAYPTGTAGANDWFEITGVQLEIGSVATPFSRAGGTLSGELQACQRYYYNSMGQNQIVGINTNATTTILTARPPVTMRTTPTATLPASGSIDSYQDGAKTTATAPTSVYLSDSLAVFASVGYLGLTVGSTSTWRLSTAFQLSAEL